MMFSFESLFSFQKADRKALKKSERQKNKKNKNKNKESLDMLMQADAPMFDAKTVSRVLTAGHKSKRGRKKSCESDSDCSGGGRSIWLLLNKLLDWAEL